MQRWCPEPFSRETGGATFEPVAAAPATSGAAAPAGHGFRPEAGFADAATLLGLLGRDERAQVLELVEQDVRREYDERHRERVAELAAEQEQLQAELRSSAAAWRRELSAAVRAEVLRTLKDLTRHTVELAVTMAEKIVRERVAIDPEILHRGIETVLYKVAAGVDLTVTVHPDDAQRLHADPELCRRLRITAIKEDRRIQPGGCLVQAGELEWDATIRQQLAVMTEVVGDALAAAIGPAPEVAPDA